MSPAERLISAIGMPKPDTVDALVDETEKAERQTGELKISGSEMLRRLTRLERFATFCSWRFFDSSLSHLGGKLFILLCFVFMFNALSRWYKHF
eukprot:1347555-Amorphochlora_amoeboformis.AAC.1